MINSLISFARVLIPVIFYVTSAAVCLTEYDNLVQDIEETERKEKLIFDHFRPIEVIFLGICIIITALTPLINCIMAEIYHSDKIYDIIMNIIRKRHEKMKIGG